MFKSLSTSLIARGILALAVGVIALAWPSVTVLALVILFAIYAFIAAGLQAAHAFSSATAGPVFGHLLLGLVDLAAGVIALAWPGPGRDRPHPGSDGAPRRSADNGGADRSWIRYNQH
jgi:uncharacterized membrane protein HdeD (DUF308 family)